VFNSMRVKFANLILIGLVAGLVMACSGPDVEPTEEAAGPTPTGTPFLVPYTPTPVVATKPIDPAVLEIIGAGPRKEFPQELMPGSPELPQDEVVRLWTEFISNTYQIQDATYILYDCEGGLSGATKVAASPDNELGHEHWAIIPTESFDLAEWNEARYKKIGYNWSDSGLLSPPGPDGRFMADNPNAPQSAAFHEKTDCPKAADPEVKPTPLPILPESKPQALRSLPVELIDSDDSLDQQIAAWTSYLSGTHMIPTGITQLGKNEADDIDPTLARYLFNAHHISGSFDLLLCGDGKYHWLGSAPLRIGDYTGSSWQWGQDGVWNIIERDGKPVMHLLPDDPQLALETPQFPLVVENDEFLSTILRKSRRGADLVFELHEASGCQ
jgi:hypothetical protein